MKRLIIQVILLSLLTVSAYAAVDLGTAADFGLLAGSTVTNTGSSVINGDVGVSPGSAVTGFYPDGIVNGNLYLAANAITAQAQLDLGVAYGVAAGAASTAALPGSVGTLSLDPGVYTFSSDALLTGVLTLEGNGDSTAQWIFQIPTALTTNPGSSVILTNGATKCQVFWQVGSSATIAESTFVGTIMADQSISLGGGTLYGRALAMNAAVTISKAETVYADPCSPTPPTAVPEASTLIGFGSALALTGPGLLGWLRRHRA